MVLFSRRIISLIGFFSLILMLSLSACGPIRSRTAPLAVVRVHFDSQSALAEIPLAVANRLGLFRQQGITVQAGTADRSAITIGPAGHAWPITGVLTQGLDGLVAAPHADPGFRLAALRQVPIAYTRGDRALAFTFQIVMHQHQIDDYMLEPLDVKEVMTLFTRGHLPYVLVEATLWARLASGQPDAHILAALSAASGPIPSIVVTGSDGALPNFLAALNLSLWYIETEPAVTVWNQLPPRLHTHEILTVLQLADRYQWFSPSTVPDRQRYQRGQALWSALGHPWPSYYRAVNARPALTALSLTP
jgi:hypothetical protein